MFDLRAVARLIPLYAALKLKMAKRDGGEKAMQSVVIRITPRDGALLAKVVESYLALGHTCLEPLLTSCGYARYKSWMPLS